MNCPGVVRGSNEEAEGSGNAGLDLSCETRRHILQQGHQECTGERGTGNIRKFCGGLLCLPGLSVDRKMATELSLLITTGVDLKL